MSVPRKKATDRTIILPNGRKLMLCRLSDGVTCISGQPDQYGTIQVDMSRYYAIQPDGSLRRVKRARMVQL